MASSPSPGPSGAELMGLGALLAGAVVAPIVLGIVLDGALRTSPVFLFAGLVVGIYSNTNGHPGTLLTKGTRSALTPGAWNTVTVPSASVTAGQTYWVGLLGTGGTLQFRGGSAAGCRSEGSRSSTLSTLPTTWATGATWGTCPPSAYATSWKRHSPKKAATTSAP